MKIISSLADLRRDPDPSSPLDSQLLYGEEVTTIKERDGYYLIEAKSDGYKGWVKANQLNESCCIANHRLSALRSLVYSRPDIKSSPMGMVHLNATFRVKIDDDTRFMQITDQSDLTGGYIFAAHLRPIDQFAKDPVAIANMFIHAPYYWGGKSSFGLDCSALTQHAYAACGVVIPRDSGDQQEFMRLNHLTIYERAEGDDKPISDMKLDLQAGDLVFMKGHVSMMINGKDMIHANGTEMKVSIHNLFDFSGNIATESGKILGIYRLAT